MKTALLLLSGMTFHAFFQFTSERVELFSACLFPRFSFDAARAFLKVLKRVKQF